MTSCNADLHLRPGDVSILLSTPSRPVPFSPGTVPVATNDHVFRIGRADALRNDRAKPNLGGDLAADLAVQNFADAFGPFTFHAEMKGPDAEALLAAWSLRPSDGAGAAFWKLTLTRRVGHVARHVVDADGLPSAGWDADLARLLLQPVAVKTRGSIHLPAVRIDQPIAPGA